VGVGVPDEAAGAGGVGSAVRGRSRSAERRPEVLRACRWLTAPRQVRRRGRVTAGVVMGRLRKYTKYVYFCEESITPPASERHGTVQPGAPPRPPAGRHLRGDPSPDRRAATRN